MKILFIPAVGNGDYQQDCLFHGLHSLLGPDCVDYDPLYYMYKGVNTASLYGKGFTLYGLLDNIADRTDLDSKIRNHYFDYAIFGSVQRDHYHYGQIADFFPPQNIAFIDGEDGPLYMKDAADRGVYFKRELHSPKPGVFPIQFAIPEEKVITSHSKSAMLAPLDPMDTRTYIYNDEPSYYESYRSAMFGKTMKKAGWDCLRHYEILASMCLPYFQNIEHCPYTIMMEFPKQECAVINSLLEYQGFNIFERSSGRELWADLMQRCHEILMSKLTTKALATRFLDQMRSL